MYCCMLCGHQSHMHGHCAVCSGMMVFQAQEPVTDKGTGSSLWPILALLAGMGFLMQLSSLLP